MTFKYLSPSISTYFFLSLSHTQHTHTHAHAHSHSLFCFSALLLSHSLSHTHTHTITISFSLSISLSHILVFCSFSALTHTHTITLSITHTHTHKHSHGWTMKENLKLKWKSFVPFKFLYVLTTWGQVTTYIWAGSCWTCHWKYFPTLCITNLDKFNLVCWCGLRLLPVWANETEGPKTLKL